MSSEPKGRAHKLYHLLSRDPLIIVTYERLASIDQMSTLIDRSAAWFLVIFKITMEDEERVGELASSYRLYREKYPDFRVIFLCNTTVELELLEDQGLPSIFCNQNAFLDEEVYRLHPEIEPTFDAVYNAQFLPFKRHHLARHLESLALITYSLYYLATERRRAAFDEVRRHLPGARVLNCPGDPRLEECSFETEMPKIRLQHISRHLARARVGLILSRVEGASWVSYEYLLSGRPVVSTQSLGGREVFFDPDYVVTVADSAQAVRDGVREAARCALGGEQIRERTLQLTRPHRERFCRLINRIYQRAGCDRDFEQEWGDVFINKMMRAEAWPGDFEARVNSPDTRRPELAGSARGLESQAVSRTGRR